MPKFLEKKLKARYGKKSKIPYKIMNKLGAMRGNKETAKGRAMAKKHAAKKKRKKKGLAYKVGRALS
jgi:hypothetical protein